MDTASAIAWLQSTALSQAIQSTSWAWPLCETLHFIGLALLIGIAGLFDLRLMGVMRRVPLTAVMEFMPWAVGGFLLNMTTGIIFFIGHPEQYVNNVSFWFKVFFLLVAGLNAMFFQTAMAGKVRALPADQDTPLSFKLVGGMSLFAWFAVLFFGRMLPYIGNSN